MNFLKFSSIVTSIFLASTISNAQNLKFLNEEIVINANSVTFEGDSNILSAEGDVIITAGDTTLNCQKALINKNTGEFFADGDVSLKQLENYLNTDKITGNFRSGEFETDKYKIKRDALYAISESAKRFPSSPYTNSADEAKVAEHTELNQVTFSTCDYLLDGHAHYTVSAKRVVIKPDGYFTAYNLTVKVGKVPILWLPS
ncbi:MAG: hypothetical protein ACRC37_05780, partial [Lentisphaeria bacterium]